MASPLRSARAFLEGWPLSEGLEALDGGHAASAVRFTDVCKYPGDYIVGDVRQKVVSCGGLEGQ